MQAGLRGVFLLGAVTMLIAFLLILTIPEVSMDAVVEDKKIRNQQWQRWRQTDEGKGHETRSKLRVNPGVDMRGIALQGRMVFAPARAPWSAALAFGRPRGAFQAWIEPAVLRENLLIFPVIV